MCAINQNYLKLFVGKLRFKFNSTYKQNFDGNTRRHSHANIVNTNNNKLEIPQCPPSSLIDSIISLVSHDKALNLHELVNKRHEELGPIYRDHVGLVSLIFINSPDEYKKIFKLEGDTPGHFIPEAWILYNQMKKRPRGLFFMESEEWLHFRRIFNRLLLAPNLAGSVVDDSCRQAAITLTKKWGQHVKGYWIVDNLEKHLYQWSIEVMIATLLGSNWMNYKEITIHQENIEKLANFVHKVFELSARLSVLPVKYVKQFRLPLWREFVRVLDNIFGIVEELMKGIKDMKGLEHNGLMLLMKKEGIKDSDLVRIVTDFILAAGDTTAFSTLWALYLLATHPDVQNKVVQKISSSESHTIITDSYIRGIIKETLRLFPTAPFLSRVLARDAIIANYPVSKGEWIIMSLYSSGRDAKNFIQPNEFLPDRWVRNEKGQYEKVLNAFGSIPFAIGARSCIGRKLAETQMLYTLTELIKTFEFECLNIDKVKMKLHLISVPSVPIQFKLKSRNRNWL